MSNPSGSGGLEPVSARVKGIEGSPISNWCCKGY